MAKSNIARRFNQSSWDKRSKLAKLHYQAYTTWVSMIARCTNPNKDNYKNYGALGITVCKKWETFAGFFSDMGDPPNDLHGHRMTLDRQNNNLGYNKENCIWNTRTVQSSTANHSKIINSLKI